MADVPASEALVHLLLQELRLTGASPEKIEKIFSIVYDTRLDKNTGQVNAGQE